MRKLTVFNSISLDGFFSGENGDLVWAHRAQPDPEFDAFIAGNAGGEGPLLFGRKTYEMMVSYWPTPAAMKASPDVAKGMNRLPKVVFSRTLTSSSWSNTTFVKDDIGGAVRKLKQEAGEGMTILGSGSIISQLADEGLIDAYQFVVNPIVLGKGTTMFARIREKFPLKLTKSRAFGNGIVLLTYEI